MKRVPMMSALIGSHCLSVRRYAVIAIVEVFTLGRIQLKIVKGFEVRWLAEHTRWETIGL